MWTDTLSAGNMYSFVCPKGVVVQMERGDFVQVMCEFYKRLLSL